MTTEDLKIGFLNFSTFLVSFSNIESILKIILLIVSIVYTLNKIVNLRNEKKNK